MTQYSAKAAIPYAELTDAPNIQTYAQGLSNVLDGITVPKYATVTDRNTANPTPTAGDMCYCADTDWVYFFSGAVSAWCSFLPKTIYRTSGLTKASTTSVTLDTVLQIAVEASSAYVWSIGCIYSFTAVGAGFRDNITGPAGCNVSVISTNISTTASSFNGADATANWVSTRLGTSPVTMSGGDGVGSGTDYSHFMEGVLTTTNAGTFGLQWAQHVSSVNSTGLNSGSFLTIQKIG